MQSSVAETCHGGDAIDCQQSRQICHNQADRIVQMGWQGLSRSVDSHCSLSHESSLAGPLRQEKFVATYHYMPTRAFDREIQSSVMVPMPACRAGLRALRIPRHQAAAVGGDVTAGPLASVFTLPWVAVNGDC